MDKDRKITGMSGLYGAVDFQAALLEFLGMEVDKKEILKRFREEGIIGIRYSEGEVKYLKR